MVHARRKLFELAAVGKAPIAAEAVRRIDGLFAIERDISGKPAAERLAVREERAGPLVAELEAWLRAQHARVSPKSETGKAIAYALNQWKALTRFLEDGRICLSNNAAERALRGVATRRSLCPPSLSLWKHWKLVFGRGAIRAICSLNGGGHPFALQVGSADLVRSARHNLLGGENAVPD